jgi:hypothetical protein
MNCATEESVLDFWQNREFFTFSTASRPPQVPTQPHGALSPGGKAGDAKLITHFHLTPRLRICGRFVSKREALHLPRRFWTIATNIRRLSPSVLFLLDIYTMAYRPIVQRSLCKQRQLIGNARNKHAPTRIRELRFLLVRTEML